MRKIILLLSLILVATSLNVVAQDNTEVVQDKPKTLFTYPQAPDTIKEFQDRANYVVIRFWNNFDLSKPIADEVAFEGAFQDYLNLFPHAHKTVVINSIKDIMNKAQSNKANFMLIGRLAEKNLYSEQAVFASDEAYIPFVDAMLKSNLLKKNEKEYYKKQIVKINQNAYGAPCPELNVVGLDGDKMKLTSLLGDKATMLFFNDGDCSDCMFGRLRLSTNVTINSLVKEGALKIICIIPKKYSKELAEEVKGWADNWTIVTAEDATEVFDLRIAPSIYILNENKEIDNKNLSVEMVIR